MTRCPNLDCPAQLKNNVLHLASREALDVDGLGEKLVDQLVDAGLVKRPVGRLRPRRGHPRGPRAHGREVGSEPRGRPRPCTRDDAAHALLIALGIRHVGAGVADLLASHFGDLDALVRASQDELEAVPGVGPTIAESVVRFFADPHNRKEVERLEHLGVRWPKAAAPRAALGAARRQDASS